MDDPKYRPNEIDQIMMCTRCADSVPVYLKRVLDRFETRVEIHCLNCKLNGHKGGTYIGELQKGC